MKPEAGPRTPGFRLFYCLLEETQMKEYLQTSAAARELTCSEQTIRQLADRGHVKAIRTDGRPTLACRFSRLVVALLRG
jgi:hypothetical protein